MRSTPNYALNFVHQVFTIIHIHGRNVFTLN